MKQATKSLITLLAAGTLLGVGVGLGPSIDREGGADHQQALHAIEAEAFDAGLLSGLDNWTHGQPLDASALEGNVTLIATVAVNDPQSMLILSTLARYERQHGEKGLVALAVHPEQGWEALSEKISAGRIKVQAARDVGGAFAEGVHADNYPDLFLIDRAGQLRYADIENSSLRRAVAQLLRETPEQAIANAKLQSEGVEIAAGEDDGATDASEAGGISPEEYADANWPAHNSGFKARDYQGKALPAALGNEEWLSEEKNIENKVLVLDFWATWCGPCRAASPKLEEIQQEHEGKVEVLAIGGSSDDERTHKRYVYASEKAYSNLYDKNDTLYRPLGITAIPHTVVVSSDGVVRWQGNPLSSSFKDIVRQVVEADPMFKPRRSGDAGDEGDNAGGERSAEAYASAPWPAHNRGKLYAADNQGNKLPVPLGGEKWLSPERDLGGKVVMLDFWATWCGPCKQFSPVADRLQQKYEGKLEVLAISGQNDPEGTVRSYIRRNDVSYAHLYDRDQAVYKSLKVTGIPHVVIMSSDGVIRWQGFPGGRDFERALDQIIAADPALQDG